MSNITNSSPVVTEDKLKDFYEDIKPFLGCPAYLTSEGTSDYYSTDEKVIGRWTDGKPLYQKTIYVASATKYLNIQDMSGKELKQLNGVFDNGSANEVLPYADNSGYVCLVHVLNNNLQVYLNTFSSVANLYVTIQYTKTTDSASTTIQEDPNEYSTDEKIIGKWIDGKPIYQKTYNLTNTVELTKDNWTVINEVNDLTNVNAIIDCNVFTSGGTFMVVHASLDSNKLKLGAPNSSNFRYIIKTITIKYLKTTD